MTALSLSMAHLASPLDLWTGRREAQELIPARQADLR